jgi:hypothetical protein
VGKQKFYIHAGTLTVTSEFFKNAMKPEWRANSKKAIDLSDEDPEEFESYSRWLYSGKVTVTPPFADIHTQFANLYVLGERLLDETFQDAVLAAIINATREGMFPSNKAIRVIYAGTTSASSPARRLMVDIFAYASEEEWFGSESFAKATSVEFVEDLVRGFARLCARTFTDDRHFPWLVNPGAYSLAALRAEQNKKEEADKARDDSMDVAD